MKASSAVSDADPGSEDEIFASREGENGFDDNWRHRVKQRTLGEGPYLARQL